MWSIQQQSWAPILLLTLPPYGVVNPATNSPDPLEKSCKRPQTPFIRRGADNPTMILAGGRGLQGRKQVNSLIFLGEYRFGEAILKLESAIVSMESVDLQVPGQDRR